MAASDAASTTDVIFGEVETTTSSQLIVPSKGSVAAIGLPLVVTHIERHKLSAELEVLTGPAIKSVLFENGVIVFAKSNLTSDRLGNCLLQTGKISREQFNAIDERMQRGGIRFGEALVAEGWMSPQEVVRHVGTHLGKIVLSLLPLQEGSYRFEERAPRVPPELKVKLFTGQLLLFGVRRIPSDALIRTRLPAKQTPLRCVRPAPSFLKLTKLHPLEKAIVDKVEQGATLGSLEEVLSEAPDDIRRATYGLLLSGILAPLEEEGAYVLSAAKPMQNQTAERHPTTASLRKGTSSDLRPAGDHAPADPATTSESDAVTNWGASSSNTPVPQHSNEQNDEALGRERQLLETVELHIAVEDWRQSIPLLTELLEIAPQNAKYNVLLACALGKCKGLEKHAERQFQRALRYAPGSADLYCEFGHFYATMGRAGRATQQFQEALRLDPDHKGAQEAVQQQRRAQGSSLGSMFKKMLR